MTEKEFKTLGDEILPEGENTWGCKYGWLDVEDVKEFIKRLKEVLLDYQYQTNPQLNEYCHNNIIKQIDKLAGSKLS